MKKIKRILSSLLVVIMLVGIAPISNYAIKASAEENYNGLIYDFIVIAYAEKGNVLRFEKAIAITGCDEKSGELIIPSSIDGYRVKDIRSYAFSYCTEITGITIPESVTSIGNSIFEGCTNLSKIQVSKNNKVYDSRNDCNAIIKTAENKLIAGCKDTVIPDGVEAIEYNAFSCCTGLTSITIPDSVTSIDADAFYCCGGLNQITVSKNNKVYDSRNNCNAIIETATNTLYKGCNNTVIPYGVEAISDGAFEFCTGLTNITIPDSVKFIGQNAFSNTGYFLDENNWENGVLYIGKHLIFVRDATESYSIKEGTKTIADCAFSDRGNLIRITIPNSVISIGNYSFAGCSNLENVTIPDGVTYIGGSAFSGCTKFTDVKIPSSVKKIDDYAFYGCTSLDNIKIPNEVSYIGQEAFNDTGYYNNESNWENNVLYINNHLVSAKNDVSGSYSIKEGIKTIASSAFVDCNDLKNIAIPNSVTVIGINAFYRCSNLKSVVIPKNVSSIGVGAFGYIENEYYATIKKEDFKIYCYSGTAGEKYAIDNGFKYELLNEECSHKLNHITVPSTCKVVGMEYDICSECGETFNEKTLPLAAHTWSEWTVVKEATATVEGQEKRTCSVCNKVETRAIEKLKVIKDDKTGIEINYNDEYDSDTEIKVEEQFSGKSFQLINTEFGKVNSKIYDIATYKDGVKVQPNGEITVKIPLPTGYSKKVFVCYVDSTNGKVTKIPCEVKDGYVIFKTNHFSEYAIVEQSANVKSVSVSDITLNYKKSATIKPTIKADDGAKYTVEYSSSNTKVATVDNNGKVYGAKKGSATITCTVTDSNGNVATDTCKVTVGYSFGQWLIVIVLFGWIWY